MIDGYLDHDGSWKIGVYLLNCQLPRDREFRFLIDTGADKTILSSSVVKDLGIDINYLPTPKEVVVQPGGEVETRCIPGVGIEFRNTELMHREPCEIMLVCDLGWDYDGLIGRDILNRFDISTDIKNEKIHLDRIASVPPTYKITKLNPH
jgi:hypothetical protein